MHGKLSGIHPLTEDELLEGINQAFNVVRYHSLVVGSLENTLLRPLASTNENENMIFKHQLLPIYGLTEHGLKILSNWNAMVKRKSEGIENKL